MIPSCPQLSPVTEIIGISASLFKTRSKIDFRFNPRDDPLLHHNLLVMSLTFVAVKPAPVPGLPGDNLVLGTAAAGGNCPLS
jgi:hypothetical protein